MVLTKHYVQSYAYTCTHTLTTALHYVILILLHINFISYILSIPSVCLLITYQMITVSFTSFWLNS